MTDDPLGRTQGELAFPRLWCPLLTHYDAGGALDVARMQAHLAYLRPHVSAFLVPGSTGDGWLLSDAESRAVLALLLDAIDREPSDESVVMVGALKATTEDACRCIRETIDWLRERTGAPDAAVALQRSRVAGFTVCPPTGVNLSPAAIERALTEVLALGLPTALYQLPQITQNEMPPEMVARLAARFDNLILFKDSSGADAVALAGLDLGRVFLVRGAEGDYGKWLKGSGGPYDGYLLSTANCFAAELRAIVDAAAAGRSRDPDLVRLAASVSECVADAFAAVSGVTAPGNAFTHANKALDHFMAYGQNAPLDADALPILYGGVRLPHSAVASVGAALVRWGIMPDAGYLQSP